MNTIDIGLCWGTVRQAGLVEMIELAGRHGFPTLEVPPHIYDAALATGETPGSLRERLAAAGTRVRVIDCLAAGMPGMPPVPSVVGGQSIRQYGVDECLAIADALDAPIINISLYHSAPVPIGVMAAAVATVCRRVGPRHSVVLEFYPESGIASLGQAHAIARECGEPNCAVMLDLWHFARSGGTVAELECLPPGAIGALQLSDRTEPAPGSAYVPMSGRKLPGDGELPLYALLDAAITNNPTITAEVEVFSDELADLPADAAAARTAAAIQAWGTAGA